MKEFRMPLSIWPETTLDEVVNILHMCKDSYFDFLGHELDSNVTLEEAYQEVYGMTREEYRREMQKSYEEYKKRTKEFFEKSRKEEEERRERVITKAREIIPEDQMNVMENVYSELGLEFLLLKEETCYEYLNLIAYLNSDDYSLEEAEKMYERIKPRFIKRNAYILKSIKLLSKHGSALYDLLYDEEAIKRFEEAVKKYASSPHKIEPLLPINNRPLTPEEKLTSYDRMITSYRLLGYNFSKKENKTL